MRTIKCDKCGRTSDMVGGTWTHVAVTTGRYSAQERDFCESCAPIILRWFSG